MGEERSAFERAHEAWAAGDLKSFLKLMSQDIIYTVNVDGMQVPYAMSAVGKADLEDRLQLLLDTFDVKTLETEHLVHGINHGRSHVHGVGIRRRGDFGYQGALSRLGESWPGVERVEH